jgi:tRNA A-37 threonylcarbamoyl transferase component Bud32
MFFFPCNLGQGLAAVRTDVENVGVDVKVLATATAFKLRS